MTERPQTQGWAQGKLTGSALRMIFSGWFENLFREVFLKV